MGEMTPPPQWPEMDLRACFRKLSLYGICNDTDSILTPRAALR